MKTNASKFGSHRGRRVKKQTVLRLRGVAVVLFALIAAALVLAWCAAPTSTEQAPQKVQKKVDQAGPRTVRAMTTVKVAGPHGAVTRAVRPRPTPKARDGNPALTAKVKAALANGALMTSGDVSSVTSRPNGAVTVTLVKTAEQLTGLAGAKAVSVAARAARVGGGDLLSRVREATSVTVRDAKKRVLAVSVRT